MREFVRRLPPELQQVWHETVGESYRQRAAQRAIVEGSCAFCGAPFVGIRKRRYCSGRCRQAAYAERKASRNGTSPTASAGGAGEPNMPRPD